MDPLTLSLISAGVSAVGSVVGGVAANNQAKAEAEAMKIKAGQERAAAQRNAEQKQKEGQLIMSRQRAVAAASGGGATDSTVLDLTAKTAGEADLQARNIQYEGVEAARTLNNQANITRMQGRQALFSSFIDAGGSLLSGLNSWSKYRKPRDPWSMPVALGPSGPQYRYLP